MHPASALFVQKDSLGAPFKVANFGGAGRHHHRRPDRRDQRRPDGAARHHGRHLDPHLPRQDAFGHHACVGPRGERGDDVLPAAGQPRCGPRVLGPGSELQKWTINGTDNGAPFKVSHTDRFSSDFDIAFESPWDVADAVWALSSMPGVVVDDVTINGDLVDDSSTWRVTRLQQNRGGRWFTLDRRHPAFGQAGGTLRVRALLENRTDGPDRLPLAIPVPPRARHTSGAIFVGGGASSWFNAGRANSVDPAEDVPVDDGAQRRGRGPALLEGDRAMIESRNVSRADRQGRPRSAPRRAVVVR